MCSWERSRERFSKSASPFDLPTFVSIASINRFDSSSRVLKVFWPANNCLGVHEKAFHLIVLNLCDGFFQLSLYCRTAREIANYLTKSKLELFQIHPNLLSLWSQISSGMIDSKTNCTCVCVARGHRDLGEQGCFICQFLSILANYLLLHVGDTRFRPTFANLDTWITI